MRYPLISLLTLCFFAFAQLATAYDMCCGDSSAAGYQEMAVKADKSETANQDASKSVAGHCGLSCHASLAFYMGQHNPTSHNEIQVQNTWPDSAVLHSFIGEGLIEPPSFA